MNNFRRTIDQLEEKSVKWWPSELSEKESSLSVIPLLLKTQEDFISILKLSKSKPTQVFQVLEASKFPANLFVKHLVVLSDFGGEQIQRLNRNFNQLFPSSEILQPRSFEFHWNRQKFKYFFRKLPLTGLLNNSKLGIDGKGIQKSEKIDGLKKDMIMILLFGGSSDDLRVSEILARCEVGNLLGKPDDLETYVRQKYIWVSRITTGAQANTLGQVAQKHVIAFLRNNLSNDFQVIPNGHVEGVSHTEEGAPTKFDVVVVRGKKAAAVEISFQVTTNSVIERKAGQAKARYERIKRTGNFITYIIDGAGNFQRRSAVSIICDHSDCTVAYSSDEFKVLIRFLKEVLG